MQLRVGGFYLNFERDIEMGNLVLTRKPGESIDIYDPDNAAVGVIVITQGTIRGKHSSIAIDAPRHLHVKRSEISDKQPASVNKYYSLGPDPIAAIKSIGFTREVGRFGVLAYVHESLPLDMRHHGSQEGWMCVLNGERAVLEPESMEELKFCVLGFALEELKNKQELATVDYASVLSQELKKAGAK